MCHTKFFQSSGSLFQRLDDKRVLQALLQNGLYATFGVANIMSQTTHLTHIKPTADEKHGNDANDDTRQRAVHPEQEKKSSDKLHQSANKRWQGFGEKIDDMKPFVADEFAKAIFGE